AERMVRTLPVSRLPQRRRTRRQGYATEITPSEATPSEAPMTSREERSSTTTAQSGQEPEQPQEGGRGAPRGLGAAALHTPCVAQVRGGTRARQLGVVDPGLVVIPRALGS